MNRVSKKEYKYIGQVLDNYFRSSKSGVFLNKFEQAFSKKFGVKYSIAHVNGTATLHSALFAAGVGPGDEVIVPPLTMASTSMAVLQQDAVPVFADIDEKTFNIDPLSIEKLITPRTKAIITVAIYGLSPNMDPIMKLAKKHKLLVIEDDAQCFLGQYKGKLVGTIGHLSSFSLQGSKHISSGEGGVVCTNSPELADKVRKFSVLGYGAVSADKGKITKDDIQNPNYDRHVCLGYNYRMPEPCAAIALGQLERLDKLVDRRIKVANLLLESVKSVNWLVPQHTPKGYKHSYWSLAVRLVHPEIKWEVFRNKFMEFGGDGVYATWKLTYMEPAFQTKSFSGKEKIIKKMYKGKLQKYKKGLCPVAEKIQPQILAFKTNYWDLDRAKQQAKVLKKTIKYFN